MMRADGRFPTHAGLARPLVLLVVVAALGALAPPLTAQPQPDLPDRPLFYAVEGARIVTGPGQVVDDGTIVFSRGVVSAVGVDVEVPSEAWVVDGSGLTVYPGLIDGLTTLGLADSASGGRQGGPPGRSSGGNDDDYSWGPEDRPATTPWKSAAQEFSASDDAVKRWRDGGFTSVVTAPDDGFVSGQASVMTLRPGEPDALVVRTPAAMRLNLRGGRGHDGYPGSLMGVFAYFEQLFLDAQRYDRAWGLFEGDPRGRERPEFDRTLDPIRSAVSRGTHFLFPGDDPNEIRRALRTAEEAGFTPLVYGARTAYRAPEVLSGHPVLVGLDWPSAPSDGDPEADPSLDELRDRHFAPSTPAALADAGVRFAFYSDGLDGPGDVMAAVREAVRAGLSREDALRALTVAPAEIFEVADRLGTLEEGKAANAVVTDGDLFDEGTSVRMVFVDGRKFEVGGDGERMAEGGGDEAGSGGATGSWQPVPMARTRGPYAEPEVLAITNATVHTVTGGTLENATVVVRDGRIEAVGTDVEAPPGARVIEGDGMHVTPGIIDAHSHIAADAINEGSVSVSAMVGIQDVLDPNDVSIYRAAAGGVTMANVLHGSANPIGGKNAVIKMRWGADADGLLYDHAVPGIKFALGENTKRDRDPDRYPATRMGVQDVIRDAFQSARDYMAEWEDYEAARSRGEEPIPPREDLKLETLAEILRGERQVHAHSYRADEILQLMRTAEEFGVRIAVFQHVLEGYKVADEMAEHGAAGSTFSDWWAYKMEAYDAIPHNAALMTDRGVVVSINSDSGEEMRHLNQEAAKAMKWGGLSANEALKLVTLNPAIQLGIEDRVGSIEEGKEADLVVWNDDPLSLYAVAQTTIIDGKIYFDREMDRERQQAIEDEKEALMQQLESVGDDEAVTPDQPVAPNREEYR